MLDWYVIIGRHTRRANRLTSCLFLHEDRSNDRFQLSEAVFCVFAVSFALEEYTAQMEHGWAGKRPFHYRQGDIMLIGCHFTVYIANVSFCVQAL
jgi:hypothetical protein